MKNIKLFQIVAFCLITTMFSLSCSMMKTNDFSRQKYTNFKKGESTVNINHVTKQNKNVDLYSVAPDKKDVQETVTVIADKPFKNNLISKPEVKKESVDTSSHNKVILKETKKAKINRAASFVMNRLVNKSNTTSLNREHEGLSLFWIVILILLILWAIGLASGGFGIGGLINVLLVIALVLLILWLLEVV